MPNKEFWKNKRRSRKGRAFGQGKPDRALKRDLELEAGFAKWLAYLRQHLGSEYAWDRPYPNDLEQINAIDKKRPSCFESRRNGVRKTSTPCR